MIRAARRSDVPALFALVGELARYEKLEHERVGSQERLEEHLFGARPFCEALVAVDASPVDATASPGEDAGRVVGFALFFHNYSTFLTQPGIYLEDLFVLPDERRYGHGRALLQAVARLAVERGCGRFEWAVLHWNEPAIRFYQSLGAKPLDEWGLFRLTGDALAALGAER